MEGYLKKWVNMVVRWQDRYCILNDHILYYCEKKGGTIKGQIHLKVSAILLVPEDPLMIIIHTGTNEVQLRANSVAEKIEWVNALKREQDDCMAGPTKTFDHFKKINETLADLWVCQAAFEETLSILVPRLERQPNKDLKALALKLQEQGQSIKMNASLCAGMLEEEKSKMEQALQLDDYENGTVFQSFRERQPTEFNGESQISSSSLSPLKEPQFYSIEDILLPIRNEQPIKYKNLIENPVFRKISFSNSKYRTKLPRTQDPNEQIKLWSLLKDLIGKDLTRLAVPVYFNEPLSMLQRLAENVEYYKSLKKANQEPDQWLRMCYIMGFGVSAYAANINRHKKPFNPILGETFEIQNKDFRFVSEQVSHHPPISAGYAESNDFEFWLQTDLQTKITPRCMEVQPLGSLHVVLKQSGDHITYTKCLTKVNNIIFGQMYIDHVGDMVYTNHSTKDVGVLTLLGDHKMTGVVKDSTGRERYKLKGAWNESLTAKNVLTGQEQVVWQRHELPQDSKVYFHFTHFAMNLNHLSYDSIQKLPATDCRLRPDQLALEYGYIDLATEEKQRLEQKQRQRRKQLEQAGLHHEPQYFKLEVDKTTNEQIHVYKGNYWKRTGEGLDLF